MKTYINVIIDKSGSMASLVSDTIGGFNRLLAEQRLDDDPCRLTLTLFDTEVTTVYSGRPLKDVPDLDEQTYRPGGFTALLDALGTTLRTAEKEVALDEHCLTVIVTDGLENSSREFTRAAIKAMVDERTKAGWDFVYLGANVDAFAEAGKIGVPSAASWSATADGTRQAFQAASEMVGDYRRSGRVRTKS